MKAILSEAKLRSRAVCGIVALLRVRPEVLGNHEALDGLRVGDLPELRIENGKIEFTKIPTIVNVRRELSKNPFEYFTFLSREGCEYLKDYLEWRMKRGERLKGIIKLILPADKLCLPFLQS